MKKCPKCGSVNVEYYSPLLKIAHKLVKKAPTNELLKCNECKYIWFHDMFDHKEK